MNNVKMEAKIFPLSVSDINKYSSSITSTDMHPKSVHEHYYYVSYQALK